MSGTKNERIAALVRKGMSAPMAKAAVGVEKAIKANGKVVGTSFVLQDMLTALDKVQISHAKKNAKRIAAIDREIATLRSAASRNNAVIQRANERISKFNRAARAFRQECGKKSGFGAYLTPTGYSPTKIRSAIAKGKDTVAGIGAKQQKFNALLQKGIKAYGPGTAPTLTSAELRAQASQRRLQAQLTALGTERSKLLGF